MTFRAVEWQRHVAEHAHHAAVLRRGRAESSRAGANTTTIGATACITDGLKSTIALMTANTSYAVRPTAIYANPVLLDLIDREMKSEFNVILNTKEIAAGFTVKMLTTQAGELPLIPTGRWPTPARPARAPRCCRVHRHRRPDRVPLAQRSQPARLPAWHAGSLAAQHVVVKFGAPVVKGANYAHYQVLVDR